MQTTNTTQLSHLCMSLPKINNIEFFSVQINSSFADIQKIMYMNRLISAKVFGNARVETRIDKKTYFISIFFLAESALSISLI